MKLRTTIIVEEDLKNYDIEEILILKNALKDKFLKELGILETKKKLEKLDESFKNAVVDFEVIY